MKNEKIDMGRESDTFHVSQDGVYTITGTNSRHGITVSAGVRARRLNTFSFRSASFLSISFSFVKPSTGFSSLDLEASISSVCFPGAR